MIWKAAGPRAVLIAFGMAALALAGMTLARGAQIGGQPGAQLTAPAEGQVEDLIGKMDRALIKGAPDSLDPGGRLVAKAARLEENADSARLVFELSGPVEAAAFALAGPNRIIVDLPQVEFALDPQIGKPPRPPRHRGRRARHAKPAVLVGSFRFGQLEQGKSRIVIDLAAPARIVRAACDKSDGDGKARLVIELAKTDRAEFRAAAQSARAALAGQAQARQTQKFVAAAGRPVIMIDPGHGGIDSGAMVNGLVEKDLVFAFAKAVAAKLESDGRFMTVLTRDDDSFIPLAERVKMARNANAALFVSIHADTLSAAADVAGATVYTASDRASDAEAARLAEKENQSDAAAGLDGADDAGDVSDILFDLTRRETRAYSHVFARTLVNYWKVAGRLNKNPQRSAGFRVLRAPDVPSVLLELGYLSNEKDDAALSSAEWRDKASSRVAEAIATFFSARGSAGALVTGNKAQPPLEAPAPAPPGPGPADAGSGANNAALRAPMADAAGRR
ncbi:N-acetylmuramoyl-L-alanine amidase [Methylocapsa aurea]|uniref:N-acetylmuramoyl-L-alanine amidase n=1 Tax=Methylocapsa aurea TaxID=663610 RepID=UPI001FD94BCB|nr:N-acetylmuramoyl-L-alanine amidase [Methylocapsa aurea]